MTVFPALYSEDIVEIFRLIKETTLSTFEDIAVAIVSLLVPYVPNKSQMVVSCTLDSPRESLCTGSIPPTVRRRKSIANEVRSKSCDRVIVGTMIQDTCSTKERQTYHSPSLPPFIGTAYGTYLFVSKQ